eukprot:SAG11_NODE_1185_length_5591_cov_2.879097_2_plen_43_part_00
MQGHAGVEGASGHTVVRAEVVESCAQLTHEAHRRPLPASGIS